jgi:uncharacterized protein
MTRTAHTIGVEVVYSPQAGVVDRVPLELAPGTTALQALRASRLMERHPQIDPSVMSLGIWGRVCAPGTALREGDRLEIYRPLKVDPKEARRQRYRQQPKPERSLRRR